MKTLGVWLNDLAVGDVWEDDGRLSFLYRAQWLHRPGAFPLAAGLPLRASAIQDSDESRGVANFLSSCLPEPGDRLRQLARSARAGEGDALGMLAFFGREGPGALTFATAPGDEPIGEMEGLPVEAVGRLLQEGAPARGGLLPGRVAKMAVILDPRSDAYSERGGLTPTSHIIKISAPGAVGYRRALVGEWMVQHLAREVGLPAVEPRLRYWAEGEGVLLETARFDRHRPPFTRMTRLCTASGGMLANVAQDTPLTPSLLSALASSLQLQAQARRDLFRWAVFNFLVGNKGLHVNKVAAVRWNDGWRLAPFFGMRTTAGNKAYREGAQIAWEDATTPIQIEEPMVYPRVSREWLAAFGHGMGISARLCEEYVGRLASALMNAPTPPDSTLEPLQQEDRAYVRWVGEQVILPTATRVAAGY